MALLGDQLEIVSELENDVAKLGQWIELIKKPPKARLQVPRCVRKAAGLRIPLSESFSVN